VLAVAAALARREGLPLPIPATIVLPTAAATDEAGWQEQVIRRLDLSHWQRFEFDDELGLLGPYAQRTLTAHGLLWPANVHFHLPLLDAAHGGALVTGPVPRDVLRIGLALSPHAMRRLAIGRRVDPQIPWLADEAQAMVRARIIDDAAAEPVRLRPRMAWWHAMRYLRVGARSLELIGRGAGVAVTNPLLAPAFWAAASTAAEPAGFSSRTEGMQRLFGDLLPDDVIKRTSKADFTDVFWTGRERAFASRWSGQGLPDRWVRRDALVAHWRAENPTVASSLLLQAAWLGSQRDAGEQLLHGVVG
jgi:asparagine synthase (glutamine-hydrolysing)